MSAAASREPGLVAPPRSDPSASAHASTSGSALVATTETAPVANPAVPTVTGAGESTMFANTGTGAPMEMATTGVAGTTATPARASPATFAKPATSTHLGTPGALTNGPSPAGSVGGAVTALIVVIALILALAWLAKRMPVLGGGAGSNPALRIVGSLALGPRERVVVLAVGDTQLLIGVGVGGTRTLHTLTEPLASPAHAAPAFAQLLAQHFGKKA